MKQHDCENCPLSWEERGYEGECYDYGCMAYKNDCYGDKIICQLPNCIKKWICNAITAKKEKQEAKQFDNIGEWYTEEERKTNVMQTALTETLLSNGYDEQLYLCYCHDGKLYKYADGLISKEQAENVRLMYEELVNKEEEDEE